MTRSAYLKPALCVFRPFWGLIKLMLYFLTWGKGKTYPWTLWHHNSDHPWGCRWHFKLPLVLDSCAGRMRRHHHVRGPWQWIKALFLWIGGTYIRPIHHRSTCHMQNMLRIQCHHEHQSGIWGQTRLDRQPCTCTSFCSHIKQERGHRIYCLDEKE